MAATTPRSFRLALDEHPRVMEDRSVVAQKTFSGFAVLGAQTRDIYSLRRPVSQPPLAFDHHPVGGMGTTQYQRRKRVTGAGEAQLLKRIERHVRLLADGNRTDI